MRILKALSCTVGLFVCTSSVLGVLGVEDYSAIRLIKNAYDLTDPGARRDGSIYRTGGITNAGDLFGDTLWIEHDSGEKRMDQPLRWMRSTGYEPEIVNGGMEHLIHPSHGGDENNQVVQNESFWGLLNGWHRETPGQRHRGVTPDGFGVGGIHTFNFHTYHFDIVNDVATDMGPGWATDANANGLVTSVWSSCCGSQGNGYYSKVLSPAAADADPPYEVAAFPVTFGFSDVFPMAINNQNIIAGNMGSIFMSDRKPMKMLPTGENTWSDPIAMDILASAGSEGGTVLFSSSVIDISNNADTPFGVGISGTPSHVVIWDINEGNIVADMGERTMAWQISGDGTKVAGLRTDLTSFPPSNIPVVWSTDDGWQTFSEFNVNDALAMELGLDGADIWVELTEIDGVNDSGQIVGAGTIGTDSGDLQAIFLLDTLPLGQSVLRGDVDNSGDINNLDITPFIAALAAADEAAFLTQFPNGNYAAADIDISGSANNLDITPFIGLLTAAGSNATAVPEPGSLACIALALMMGRRRLVRR